MYRRFRHFGIGWTLYGAAISILVPAMLVSAVAAQETPVVAVKAGTVYPVTSEPIENGIVLIRDGKITAVGTDVPIPQGAEVIDATDKVVIPGLIDALTTLAERDRDDAESVTPDISAIDAFDFYGEYRRFLAGGVTTVYVSPGRRRLISGLGTVVKLAGDSIDDRCLVDRSALRVAIGEWPKYPPAIWDPPIPPDPCHPMLPEKKQLPTTRMGELALLRKVFGRARLYMNERSQQVDLKMEALLPFMTRKLPVRINCHNAQDIRSAISLCEAFNIDLIIEGGTEAYAATDEIRRVNAPVVVEGVFEPGRKYAGDNTRDLMFGRANPASPRLLAEAGIKFSLSSATDETIGDLQFVAGCAVSQGLSPEEALKAITISPAEILGVADRVGSIEKGKDADLVVLTSDPFDVRAGVDKTIIDGKVVYSRPKTPPADDLAEQRAATAIRAGRILTASSGTVDDGLILIQANKITYVGQRAEIPQHATVIDASDGVVIPGLLDIHSHLGLHWESVPVRMNPSAPTTGPASDEVRLVSIANAVAPNDAGFEEALRSGVTSVLLAPDTRGLVSGNGALIKLAGDRMEDMIVREYAAIKFSMLGSAAKMTQVWKARDLLKRAKEYGQTWDEYERQYKEYERRLQYEESRDEGSRQKESLKEPDRPKRDTNLELLRGLFKREMPVLVHAGRSDEIRNALKVFRDEYNLDVIILGGEDSFRITDELRKYRTGVAIGPDILRYEKGEPINNADLLTRNGVRVALHTSATSGTQYLPMNAAYAIRHGMDKDQALRAITVNPAQMLGVDYRIGSIGKGKDADLVILSGEPFDFRSRVEKVIVNGRIVFERKD